MITLYHITTEEGLAQILEGGFRGGRVYFSKPEFLKEWLRRLRGEDVESARLLEVQVTPDFYEQEFYDWDDDEFSSRDCRGQVSYGEGRHGWNAPERRPPLVPSDSCCIKAVSVEVSP